MSQMYIVVRKINFVKIRYAWHFPPSISIGWFIYGQKRCSKNSHPTKYDRHRCLSRNEG